MALTIGELNGIITIDDSAVDPALRRVQRAMQTTGRQLGSDATRAGQQAGTQLGGGFVRGADGQWRDLRGMLVDQVTAAALEAEAQAHRAGARVAAGVTDGLGDLDGQARRIGRQAGDDLGDGLADGSGDGADEAVGGITSKLEKLKLGVAAIGAAAGAYLMDAMTTAIEQGKITGHLQAQLGATAPQAQKYGHVAGQLYAKAVTEDFQGAADAIGAVMGAGLLDPTATNDQIESISTKVSDLATTFDQDLGGVVNAVSQMVRTGLAKNAGEALDVLTAGFQSSANKADDLVDTFNEYGTQFRKAGIDGSQAVGLMNQAIKAGARDSDIAADAIKEFSIRAVDGSKSTADGFTKLGLNADDMAAKFAKGGKTANGVLDLTLKKLRDVKDPVKQSQIAVELFGTQAEDLGKALFAMDPSKAVDTLGKVGGAAGKMGDALRDNASTKVEQFKRGLQQGVIDFLGTKVLPVLDHVKGNLGHLWDDAGKGGKEGADRVVGFVELVAQRLVAKGKELVPRLGGMISGAFQDLGAWIMANPEEALHLSLIAAGIIAGILTLPVLVAASVVAAGVTMTVSLSRGLINGFNQRIGGLGATAASWFGSMWSRYIAGPVSRTWASFMGTVQALPGRASGALSGLGGSLAGAASRGWASFQSASSKKAAAFIGWVHGLPGRISAGVGSLGSLLTGQGRNVVQGLWNGISSMGGWIKSKLYGWARSAIPGPIAKALGIASPSKVTKAQGRWVARGLVDGMTGGTKQIKAAAAKMSDIIADGLRPGKKRSKALATLGAGTKRLLSLASQEEKVAARLKTAQKKLSDQIAARDKLAASVKQGVLDSANITTQETGGWPQTADTILAGLKADRVAAERFAKNLATLRKKGVRADLIAQIAQAGVDQGSSAAAALASANSSQIKAINSQQAALVKAAGSAGTSAGDAMYGAGIQAARGLVKGLQSQQKAIDSQMAKIAKSMAKSIRKELGIKSPSKVMALIGKYTGMGLIKGVEGQRSAVNASMASLVETPAPGSWDMASSGARARASQRAVLELRSSGRGEDNYLINRVRRGIRKRAGGDVDLALAGRRAG